MKRLNILKKISDIRIIKKENIFQHNRYPYEELVIASENMEIENNKIIINMPYGFMVEFKIDKEFYDNELNEVLLNINNFDNIVQEDIKIKYKKTRSNIKRYKAHIAYIKVFENEVQIEYWGDELRNKFHYIFYKGNNGWKRK